MGLEVMHIICMRLRLNKQAVLHVEIMVDTAYWDSIAECCHSCASNMP